jgi:hypothetical protein
LASPCPAATATVAIRSALGSRQKPGVIRIAGACRGAPEWYKLNALIHSRTGLMFINNKYPVCVYKKLIINFNLLILLYIFLWIEIEQFNVNTKKTGVWRALPQIIHRVIHRFCG